MNLYLKNCLLGATVIPLLIVSLTAVGQTTKEKDSEDFGDNGQKNHQAGVSLTSAQMALANINVVELTPRIFNHTLYAPGEVKANGYTSYLVTPRVESVVLSRHATLGEHVEKGQPLVTLFSESVAEAQAAYRVAYADWQRVQQLTVETLSDSDILSVQTDYIAALSRLKAYGLTDKAIAVVAENKSSALGEYTLQAERAGAVLSDDFNQGQRVSAGDTIMILTDETELWVEAQLAPNKHIQLPKGTQARIKVGDQTYNAEVIQEAHTINRQTRTRVVRLLVNNVHHRLHPGMFVDVNFFQTSNTPVLAVPDTALMRGDDGDWTIYVEHETNEFEPLEVEVGQAFIDAENPESHWQQISGVASGSRIAITGAFFISSQIAKSGFDPHNH